MKNFKKLLVLLLIVFSISLVSCGETEQPTEPSQETVDQFKDIVYVWKEDYSSCTATKECINDASKTIVETVSSKSEKVDPTCTQKGSITYTASFKTEGFVTQTKKVDLDMIEHNPSTPTYKWNEDHTKCFMILTCSYGCGTVKENEGHVKVEKVEASCEKDGYIKYTGTFDTLGSETLEYTEPIVKTGHKYGEVSYVWNADYTKCTAKQVCENDETHIVEETVDAVITTVEPTYEAKGKKTFTATFTKEGFKAQVHETEIPALNHEYEEVKYEWNDDYTKCSASKVCKTDSNLTITETVDAVVTKVDPTCTDAGSIKCVATFTNSIFETQTYDDVIPALGHDYEDITYTWNADHSQCTALKACKNDVSHNISETKEASIEVVKEPTIDEEGLTRYTVDFENSLFETQIYEKTTSIVLSNSMDLSCGGNGVAIIEDTFTNGLLTSEVVYNFTTQSTYLFEYIYENGKLVSADFTNIQYNELFFIVELDYELIDGVYIAKSSFDSQKLVSMVEFYEDGTMKKMTFTVGGMDFAISEYDENGNRIYQLLDMMYETTFEVDEDGTEYVNLIVDGKPFVQMENKYDEDVLIESSFSISDDDLYVFEFEYVDGVINSINEYNYLKVEDEQILYEEVKTGIYKNGYYSSRVETTYEDEKSTEEIKFYYDDLDRVIKYEEIYKTNDELEHMMVEEFTYDGELITEIKKSYFDDASKAYRIIETVYEYDENDNKISYVEYESILNENDEYDTFINEKEEYEYIDDLLINHTSYTYYDNEIINIDVIDYEYNENGQIIKENEVNYHESISEENITYYCYKTYEYEGELITKHTFVNSDEYTPDVVELYEYNDKGLLIKKTQNQYYADALYSYSIEEYTYYDNGVEHEKTTKDYLPDGTMIESDYQENNLLGDRIYTESIFYSNGKMYRKDTYDYKEDEIIYNQYSYDENEELIAHVKVIMDSYYNQKESLSTQYTEEYTASMYEKYDDDNNLISSVMTVIDLEGNELMKETVNNVYDDYSNLLSEEKKGYQLGKLVHEYFGSFNSDGSTLIYYDITYDIDGNELMKDYVEYTYYEEDKVKTYESKTYENGVLLCHEASEYDIDGNELRWYESEYDLENQILYSSENISTYNELGEEVAFTYTEYEGETCVYKEVCEQTFDENNNPTGYITKTYEYDGEELVVVQTEICEATYDEAGYQLTESIKVYDADNNVIDKTCIEYTYDDNHEVLTRYQEYYDGEEVVRETFDEYKYNDNGDMIYRSNTSESSTEKTTDIDEFDDEGYHTRDYYKTETFSDDVVVYYNIYEALYDENNLIREYNEQYDNGSKTIEINEDYIYSTKQYYNDVLMYEDYLEMNRYHQPVKEYMYYYSDGEIVEGYDNSYVYEEDLEISNELKSYYDGELVEHSIFELDQENDVRLYDTLYYDGGIVTLNIKIEATDLFSKETNVYYEEGIKVRSSYLEYQYDENGNIIYKIEKEFDAEDSELSNEITEIEYDEYYNEIYRETQKYEKDILIEKYIFENDLMVYSYYLYEFSVDDEMVIRVDESTYEYDDNNNLIFENTKTYDEEGIVVEEETIVHEYDEYGNLYLLTSEIYEGDLLIAKSITEDGYDIYNYFREIYIEDEVEVVYFIEYIYEYNDDYDYTNITCKKYDTNGTVVEQSNNSFEYDEYGDLCSETLETYEKDVLIGKSIYENGHQTYDYYREIYIEDEKEVVYFMEYIYEFNDNNQYKSINFKKYDTNGTVVEENIELYEYDENGDICSIESSTYEKDVLIDKSIYEYDKLVYQYSRQIFEEDDEIIIKFYEYTYEYDEENRSLKDVWIIYDEDGNELTKEVIDYEYDGDNVTITTTHYRNSEFSDLDVYVNGFETYYARISIEPFENVDYVFYYETITEYHENGNYSKRTMNKYNEAHELISTDILVYDENGNLVE